MSERDFEGDVTVAVSGWSCVDFGRNNVWRVYDIILKIKLIQ